MTGINLPVIAERPILLVVFIVTTSFPGPLPVFQAGTCSGVGGIERIDTRLIVWRVRLGQRVIFDIWSAEQMLLLPSRIAVIESKKRIAVIQVAAPSYPAACPQKADVRATCR